VATIKRIGSLVVVVIIKYVIAVEVLDYFFGRLKVSITIKVEDIVSQLLIGYPMRTSSFTVIQVNNSVFITTWLFWQGVTHEDSSKIWQISCIAFQV
jgi:hypothetical protein